MLILEIITLLILDFPEVHFHAAQRWLIRASSASAFTTYSVWLMDRRKMPCGIYGSWCGSTGTGITHAALPIGHAEILGIHPIQVGRLNVDGPGPN